MVAKARTRKAMKALRDIDDVVHLFTGKRLKNIVGTGINIFGDELVKKVTRVLNGPEEPALPLDSPYSVLGVREDAIDVVVKGSFRSLAREFHPDTGKNPDPAKLQVVTEAYDAIMSEREAARLKKKCADKN